MTESLQEIERLMEHACVCGRGVCKSCDNLRSAITRVVQERNARNDELLRGLGAANELIAGQVARIAVLEKALREYGKHKSGCYDKRQVVPRCVCGLNAALASRDAP